jgi:hypothetical protein
MCTKISTDPKLEDEEYMMEAWFWISIRTIIGSSAECMVLDAHDMAMGHTALSSVLS